MRASELTPIAAAAAVLLTLWLLLPIQLRESAGGPSSIECLTIADQPTTDLAALERCHAVVPADVELSADLGAAYERAARVDEAIALYRKILTLDPSYADVRLRLARLLRQRGDLDGARAEVAAALRVQPNRKALTDLAAELQP